MSPTVQPVDPSRLAVPDFSVRVRFFRFLVFLTFLFFTLNITAFFLVASVKCSTFRLFRRPPHAALISTSHNFQSNVHR